MNPCPFCNHDLVRRRKTGLLTKMSYYVDVCANVACPFIDHVVYDDQYEQSCFLCKNDIPYHDRVNVHAMIADGKPFLFHKVCMRTRAV